MLPLKAKADTILESIALSGIDLSAEEEKLIRRDIANVLYSHGQEVKHECASAVNKLQPELVTQTGINREEQLVDLSFRHAEQTVMAVEQSYD